MCPAASTSCLPRAGWDLVQYSGTCRYMCTSVSAHEPLWSMYPYLKNLSMYGSNLWQISPLKLDHRCLGITPILTARASRSRNLGVCEMHALVTVQQSQRNSILPWQRGGEVEGAGRSNVTAPRKLLSTQIEPNQRQHP